MMRLNPTRLNAVRLNTIRQNPMVQGQGIGATSLVLFLSSLGLFYIRREFMIMVVLLLGSSHSESRGCYREEDRMSLET